LLSFLLGLLDLALPLSFTPALWRLKAHECVPPTVRAGLLTRTRLDLSYYLLAYPVNFRVEVDLLIPVLADDGYIEVIGLRLGTNRPVILIK
jgi:hypothetical protein